MLLETNPFLISTTEIPTFTPVIKSRDTWRFYNTSTLAFVACSFLAVSAVLSLGTLVVAATSMPIDGRLILPLGIATELTLPVLFTAWMIFTYKNLSTLKSSNLRTSAWWLVGMWVIPFLNLIEPYLVMQEIWRGSDPANINRSQYLRRKGSALVGWWWAAWMAKTAVLPLVALPFAFDPDFAGLWQITTVAKTISSIVAAVLAIVIVHRISANQAQRRLLLSNGG